LARLNGAAADSKTEAKTVNKDRALIHAGIEAVRFA